jgi:hypothetical protein
VLGELIVGGVSRRISALRAGRLLEGIRPAGAADAARCELAAQFLQDPRRIDAQISEAKNKPAMAVRACGTTLTSVFGAGPAVAATVTGEARAVSASPAGTTSPPATAPPRSRCPPAAARSAGSRGAGTGGSTTPSPRPRSPRSATATATAAPATSAN